MPKELEKKPKIHNSTRLGDLKGVALRVQGVAPKVGEQGVALKVGEKASSHLTPLQ